MILRRSLPPKCQKIQVQVEACTCCLIHFMAAAPPFARSALQSWGLCMPCWADQVGWFRPKSCDIRFAACKMPAQCAARRHCSMLSQNVGRSWSRGEGVKSPRGPACLSSGFPGRPGAGRDCRGTAMPSGPSASTLCGFFRFKCGFSGTKPPPHGLDSHCELGQKPVFT